MSSSYIASNWRLLNQENSSKSDNYGLTFDGSEYIICNEKFNFVQQTGIFSISCWIKFDNYNANSLQTILQTNGNGSSQHGFWLAYDNRTGIETNTIFFSLYRGAGGGAQDRIEKTSAIGDNNFHHIVIVSDGTDMNLFIDNSNVATFNNITISPSGVAYNNLEIGRYSSTNPFAIDGFISQVSIFDYALSSTQISTLYGSSSLGAGNPMALKPQPVAYYPLGDNSASNPLTQPNEAVEDASVFDFDVAESIKTGAISITSSSTFSLWFKKTANSAQSYGGTLLSTPYIYNASYNNTWAVAINNSNQLTLESYNGTNGNYTNPIDSTTIANNTWNNLIGVLSYTDSSNSSIQFYLNGSSFGSAISLSGRTLAGVSNGLIIGGYDFTGDGNANTYYLNGNISNVALWNSDQSSEISNIYNSGVPATSYTNTPTAWYKLDQSANWEADSAGNWQIPDAVSAYPQSFSFAQNKIIRTPNTVFDSIVTGSNKIGICTISYWFKNNNTGVQQDYMSLNDDNISPAYFRIDSSNRILYQSKTNYMRYYAPSDIDGWNHYCWVFNSDTSYSSGNPAQKDYYDDDLKFYLNGVEQQLSYNNSAAPNNTAWNGFNIAESALLSGSSLNFKVSNLQLFDTNLSASQVLQLYNNGSPLTTAIASDNLKAWYKLDNTATFSTNWSIPDASGNGNTGTSSGMTEQNLVNNNVSALNGESSGMTSANLVLSDLTRAVPYGDGYSFNFDAASSDYIITGFSIGAISQYSFSVWFKMASAPAAYSFIYADANSSGQGASARAGIGFYQNFFFATMGNGSSVYSDQTSYNISAAYDNNWHHIALIVNGTSQELYLDGSLVHTYTSSVSAGTAGTQNYTIGRYGDYNGHYFDGGVSNLSIFNEALTSTEVMKLYANGVPQDLTNFNPQPQAWWPLGSNSFWNGSQWTVRDMSTGGSNDGTGQNIGIDGLVGDAPRSSANGVGTNNSIPENLVGTTKWSENNSWSINMSETARVQDTP